MHECEVLKLNISNINLLLSLLSKTINMAKNNQLKKTRLTKKIARDQIVSTLENSLRDLQYALGEKKFQRRIKKVSKILSTGLPKSQKSKSIKDKNIILPEQTEQQSPGRESPLVKEM